MMESPLVELTRSLYHLDYFRRNFRKLGWHRCETASVSGSDCIVCSFKNVFHELSLLMREAVLDPPHIRQTIESSIENARFGKYKSVGSIPLNVPPHFQFETLLRQLEESSALPAEATPYDGSAVHSSLKLHTEFSYTKICLHCRTTSYVESVTQYVLQIDAANFVSDDWPSFEFGIKTSLDSGEFCVQPNCHGQTKVFRLLRSLPHFLPMYFSDSASVSLISFLPSRLRPHLIFESSTSVADLLLKGLILYSPQWGYATIFYHSRLELWVFIDSRRVLTLHRTWIESRFHPITHGFTVVFCFYCREEGSPQSTANSSSPSSTSSSSHYASPPTIPNKPLGSPLYKHSQYGTSEYDSSRIYENWPLDTDSGQGSEFSSTNSSSSAASNFSGVKSPNRDSHYSTSKLETSSSGSCRRHLPVKSPSILSSEGKGDDSSNNKYATVRRRVKYHGRGVKGNLASLSMSAPDLRVLVPQAPALPPPPPLTSPCLFPAVALSPKSNLSDRSSICSSSKATDTSATSKKVSFNCEVTLVDDPDDEYIPHPIFQSILQKMQQRPGSSSGSTC